MTKERRPNGTAIHTPEVQEPDEPRRETRMPSEKKGDAGRWMIPATLLVLALITAEMGLHAAANREGAAVPAAPSLEAVHTETASSDRREDGSAKNADSVPDIPKMTPTAEELAELLGYEAADGDTDLRAVDTDLRTVDMNSPAVEMAAPAVNANAEAGRGEEGDAEPEDTREEFQTVFQGRAVTITTEAEWCSFQPGDFVWDGDRLRYTGNAYEASFGIDVSAWHNKEHADGVLDWEAAREDGVEFAMIRAAYRGTTAGQLYEDPYFPQNADGAHAAGILTGAYLYSQAVSVEEALEEAEFLLDRLEGHVIDGPVCYDWEVPDRSSRAWSIPAETATACAAAFCARMAQAGYTPIIYESKYVGYMKYDQAVLEPYMRWYPQYPDRRGKTPCPDFLYQMDLWQFSDRCTVAGIGKRTDGNLWLRPKENAD
ncbi:MAG: hypothetical protein IJT94_12510 [Oscillibacter sp.]|nr:hypothetical protein [Oscillibacter sp.]